MFAHMKKAKHEFQQATEGMSWPAQGGFVLMAVFAVMVMTACYLVPLYYAEKCAAQFGVDKFGLGTAVGGIVYLWVGPQLSGLFVKLVGKVAELVEKAAAE